LATEKAISEYFHCNCPG